MVLLLLNIASKVFFLSDKNGGSNRTFIFILLLIGSVFFLNRESLCESISYPRRNIDLIAEKNGFHREPIITDLFTLVSYVKIQQKGAPLVVYIEGDGRAWLTKKTVSTDPTPRQIMVFKLAVTDDSVNVAYLARPCQYIGRKNEKNFDSVYWTSARFSGEVINSMNHALNELKKLSGTQEIKLIGFSGGGAIAVILAAGRDDVSGLCTISGNFDHIKVNEYHCVTGLDRSLNAIDFAERVSRIPQRHFAGEKDKVIPIKVVEDFVLKTGDKKLERLTIVDGCTHNKGWVKKWKKLLEEPLL